MNYDHAYHAGNFADVFKHIVLQALVKRLQQKPTALCYLDTHAAYALYELSSSAAQATGEYQQGIKSVWHAENLHPWLAEYLQLIKSFNQNDHCQIYPGSATIVAKLLRENDRMILCELMDAPYHDLKTYFRGNKQIGVHQQNGYQALKAFLPPKEKRGLVLIDPPYENPDELNQVWQWLDMALQRWPTGHYLLWYPVKHSAQLQAFQKKCQQWSQEVLWLECCPWPKDVDHRMNGTGLMLINPPWQFAEPAQKLANKLEKFWRG